MKNRILAVIALATSASVMAADAPTKSVVGEPAQEEMVAQFRSDLQAKSADIMAKNLTLTADQAAKFWPLFEAFQKEQAGIIDGQFQATQSYGKKYATLTDAEALEFVNALLARDQKVHDLRLKWLAKFQAVVPLKTAARAIQIDRRLGLATQIGISSQIPLVR